MRTIKLSDILDVPADALVYSTNILFNCTGGVGGAMMMKYGPHVQMELHELMASHSEKFMKQGSVIDYVPGGLPYRHVLHTFPCDGMYDTTAAIVEDVLRQALLICVQDHSVSRVAVSALATGYGHMTLDEFLPIAGRVFNDTIFEEIPEIVLCLPNEESFSWAEIVVHALKIDLVPDPDSIRLIKEGE